MYSNDHDINLVHDVAICTSLIRLMSPRCCNSLNPKTSIINRLYYLWAEGHHWISLFTPKSCSKSWLNCEEAHSTIQTTADGWSKIHTSTQHFLVRQTNFTVSLRFLWKTCHHLSLCGQPGIFPCWLQAVAIGSQTTGNGHLSHWQNNGYQQSPGTL